jgi:hypothetical protein
MATKTTTKTKKGDYIEQLGDAKQRPLACVYIIRQNQQTQKTQPI